MLTKTHISEDYMFWNQQALTTAFSNKEIATLKELEAALTITSVYHSLNSSIEQLSKSKESLQANMRLQAFLANYILDNEIKNTESHTTTNLNTLVKYFSLITSNVKNRDLRAALYKFNSDYQKSSINNTVAVIEWITQIATCGAVREQIDLKPLSPELINAAQITLSKEISKGKPFKPSLPISDFEPLQGYNCAACHPTNQASLKMSPKIGAELNTAEDVIKFPPRCEGYNKIVHGGFLSMALDEIMVYSLVLNLEKVALTREITIQFHRPVYIDRTYKLVGKIRSNVSNDYLLDGFIYDELTNKLCAQATGNFLIPSSDMGIRIFGEEIVNSPVANKYFLKNTSTNTL